MTLPDFEKQLTDSWNANALAWTTVVQSRQIESRRVATDAAILAAIAAYQPKHVLDVGCGEGWLARELTNRGVEVTGVDGSAALIAEAQRNVNAAFRVLDYASIIADPACLEGPYDLIVCNFSLLSEELAPLLLGLRQALSENGALIIQTIHSWSACGERPYENGWRMESFSAFGETFPQPMPWYFRTLSSWLATLQHAGFTLKECFEPIHPETRKPLSIIFVCQKH